MAHMLNKFLFILIYSIGLDDTRSYLFIVIAREKYIQ